MAPEAESKPTRIKHWADGFRAFVRRGNVVDLAVGVIIGAAFGKIVSSFVKDIVSPPLGLLLGNMKFTELKWRLGGSPEAPVTINYGNFIQAAMDFLLVAVALFFLISMVNRIHKKPPPPAASLSTDQKLLTEIRDELRKPRGSDSGPVPGPTTLQPPPGHGAGV